MGNKNRTDTPGGFRCGRKIGQSIVLVVDGKPVGKVKLTWIGKNRVEMTVDAPQSTKIYRDEVWAQIEGAVESHQTEGATDGTVTENQRLANAV